MRTKSIKIWLSLEEHAELQKLKTGHQLAAWMRETCLGKKSKSRTSPPTVDPDLLRQLAGIGNNVNQIARKCNSVLEPADAIDMLVRLEAIEQTLSDLRNKHDIQNSQ